MPLDSKRPLGLYLFATVVLVAFAARPLVAQPGSAPADAPRAGAASDPANPADSRFESAMSEGETARKTAAASARQPVEVETMDLLSLANQGGIFMYPIYFFSFVVVLFGIERAFGLRTRKIIPPELVEQFGTLASSHGTFDPRRAYKITQQYPSTAGNVIRAMLLKIGRPLSEIEHAVAAASEREAAKLYGNIRPLNLAATAGPLLGLLGTVQGMIIAFHDTANLPVGVNKAAFLAKGVYIALITTFAGLCVAIPAVCIAHFYEGRIQRLFRQIDELVANLLPQLERFEGKLRVNRQQLSSAPGDIKVESTQPHQAAAASD